MQIPDPRGLTWFQWATTVSGFNSTFGQYLRPDMGWEDFARSLSYVAPTTPRPELFDDWQAWARAVKLAVSS